MDPRPEGVYATWTMYPPEPLLGASPALVIERVFGDMTFARMILTPDEARTVAAVIAQASAA